MKNWQKTVIAILTTIFYFFSPRLSLAQFYEVSLSDKIANSSLSIEGVVLESVAFKDSNRIYTSHKVEVRNCFDIASASASSPTEQTCDSIYIITKGGHFDDEVEDWAHGLKLSAGDVGLFFLRGTSRPTLYSDHPNYEAYSEEQGFIRYNVDDKRNFVGNNIFHTYTDPETDLIEPILTQSGVGYSGEQSFIRDEWALCFLAHNFDINGDTLYFDISAKSVWGNPFAIKNLDLVLSYDSTFLGSTPLTSGVLDFVEDDSLVSDATQFSYTQNTDSSIGITISKTTFTGIQFDGLEYQRLFTAKVDLQGTPIGNISIPELAPLSSGYSIFGRNGNEKQAGEGGIEIEPGDNVNCLLGGTLDSVEPGEVGAGVLRDETYISGNSVTSGIVTIKGCGFGDLDEDSLCDELPFPAVGGYRVEFEKFNDAGWVTPLCTNYLKWDDDEIIVQVPSIGHDVTYNFGIPTISSPSFGSPDYAQNGRVRVRTPGSNPSGDDDIKVKFVHLNRFFNDDDGNPWAYRSLLKGMDDNQEGYELYFTDAFKTQFGTSGENAFKRALTSWRCETLVNFEIMEFADIINKDAACAIDYNTVPTGSQGETVVLATTDLGDAANCVTAQGERELSLKSFSIVFSDQVNWHTSTANAPSGTSDLESVALHELGHAHLLLHVVDENAIMFPQANAQKRVLTQDDIDGGIHVVQASNIAHVCDHPMIPISPFDCNVTFTSNLQKSEFGFEVIPNPAKENVFIKGFPVGSFELVLSSVHGQIISTIEITKFEDEKELELSDLPVGVYYVSIKTDQQTFTNKIVKQ